MEYGLAALKRKLAVKSARVNVRYKYYDMKNAIHDVGNVMPQSFQWLAYSLGWCSKAVDSIADRLIFDGFDNDDFQIGSIFALNNPDVLYDSSVLSAVISSCSFIYIGQNADGYPFMQVIDGGNAIGTIDSTTNLLTEGYAVLERDEYGNPILEAYLRPYQTDYYVNGVLDESKRFIHTAPYPLLVPVIYRPDAKRPFGHSRISRACIDITQAVLRTFRRMDISAEFYSFPQKYILGLSETALKGFDKDKASISAFLTVTDDENGQRPTVGQFQQQSMTPYVEELKALASVFAGETGLTIDDLGFTTSNPASYDAIKASHEQLRLTARKAQRTFGVGYLNAGYLAACIRDKYSYDRRAFAKTKPVWSPIFEPDAGALGAVGDAIYKINQAVPGFIGEKALHQMTGLVSDNDGV